MASTAWACRPTVLVHLCGSQLVLGCQLAGVGLHCMNVPHSFPLARPHHLSHMFLHRFILTSAAASAAASAAEQVFQPALAPAAAIFALGPFVPLGLHAFMPSFLLLVCMSQQFHAWSHMKKSELPEVVVALQVRPAVILNLNLEFELMDMLTAAAASIDACLVSAACSAFTHLRPAMAF